jgi:hypothetical protein
MQSSGFVLGLVLSALFASAASAATLVYRYEGQCSFDCEAQGLSVGAPATGTISIDDSGRTPDGGFGNEALLDFSFDFAGIRLAKADTAAFSFGGVWEAAPGFGPAWILGASSSDFQFVPGPTISVSATDTEGFAFAAESGYCFTSDESSCLAQTFDAAQFEMKVAPIPLPGAGVLLLGALGGLACIARGRRRSQQAAAPA